MADAPPDPWAVMVHPEDALPANGTMVRPWRLQSIAALAVPVLQQVLKVHPAGREAVASLYCFEHMLPTDLDLLLLLAERLLLLLVHEIRAVLGAHVRHFNLHTAVALSHF